MEIEHKGYKIWTVETDNGLQAFVRSLDYKPMSFDERMLGKHPVNDEFATMPFASEADAVAEVQSWIDSGAVK